MDTLTRDHDPDIPIPQEDVIDTPVLPSNTLIHTNTGQQPSFFTENNTKFYLNGSAEAHGTEGWQLEIDPSTGRKIVMGPYLRIFNLANGTMGLSTPAGEPRRYRTNVDLLRILATKDPLIATFLQERIEPALAILEKYLATRSAMALSLRSGPAQLPEGDAGGNGDVE